MPFSCPFAYRENHYDTANFILCKKKMESGKKYKSVAEQAKVMCQHQYWCAAAHTRRISDAGRNCPIFKNG